MSCTRTSNTLLDLVLPMGSSMCGNIHYVGTILVQYSHDDAVGLESIHCVIGT